MSSSSNTSPQTWTPVLDCPVNDLPVSNYKLLALFKQLCLKVSDFCAGTRGTAYRHPIMLQASFVKINLEACSLDASIRHAYQHLIVSKKALLKMIDVVTNVRAINPLLQYATASGHRGSTQVFMLNTFTINFVITKHLVFTVYVQVCYR